MKSILQILVSITFLCLQGAYGQNTYFRPTFNVGYESLPTFTPSTDAIIPNREIADRLFTYVVDSTGLEFRYSYAGCEKRAHALSLLLKGKKIPHFKIWNFDPSIISLFYRRAEPTVSNQTGLSDSVRWPYHVAILLFIKNNNAKIDTAVIDPAIASRILDYKEWLSLQNSSTSFFTILDPEWYSFVTIDQNKYNGQPLPPGFPRLLTGDFHKNEGYSVQQLWVEEALAVNKIAMKIIQEKIRGNNQDNQKREAYKNLVSNFEALTMALNSSKVPAFFTPYQNELIGYRQEFQKARDYWFSVLNPLRTN